MLTLILGPMKSGKSLELIARVAPYEFANQRVLYLQPKANVRDQGIRSRLGVDTKASSIGSLQEAPHNYDVIGIDEVHMFDAQDLGVIEAWLHKGKSLFISGLDLDYRGRMPKIIKRLLELKPEAVVYKIAACDICKQYQAQFSQILRHGKPVTSGLPVIVPEDGTYVYQARCRTCFVKEPRS